MTKRISHHVIHGIVVYKTRHPAPVPFSAKKLSLSSGALIIIYTGLNSALSSRKTISEQSESGFMDNEMWQWVIQLSMLILLGYLLYLLNTEELAVYLPYRFENVGRWRWNYPKSMRLKIELGGCGWENRSLKAWCFAREGRDVCPFLAHCPPIYPCLSLLLCYCYPYESCLLHLSCSCATVSVFTRDRLTSPHRTD